VTATWRPRTGVFARSIASGENITAASDTSALAASASPWTRWGQLVLGIICLVMIANLQYGWTLFIDPIDAKYHWGRAAIQVAFTIFIVTETWLSPLAGYLVDRFGPRLLVLASGALVATAWTINAFADSLTLIYVAAVIAGLGASPIFAATAGNAVKWFPDKRGLATGLTVAGFGAGSALTVLPLAKLIQASGFEAAFLWFGLGQGIVIIAAALMLRAPRASDHVARIAPRGGQTRRDYAPAEVLRSLPFWLMYAMFVMVGTGGLMVTAQLAPLARDFAIDTAPVSILGFTMPALGFALSLGLVLNGLSRPFFGSLSDYAGRENTMMIAFLLGGIAIFALLWFATNPILFVLLSGLVYFAWGQIFALFPATCTDLFGNKFATTNYSMLYTAKGTAALLVPLGNVLTTATGGWTTVFMLASALNILAAFVAIALLKPMRMRAIPKDNAATPHTPAVPQ
jgi:OFA family oxalate/formate antiporter-like MFS transporter